MRFRFEFVVEHWAFNRSLGKSVVLESTMFDVLYVVRYGRVNVTGLKRSIQYVSRSQFPLIHIEGLGAEKQPYFAVDMYSETSSDSAF